LLTGRVPTVIAAFPIGNLATVDLEPQACCRVYLCRRRRPIGSYLQGVAVRRAHYFVRRRPNLKAAIRLARCGIVVVIFRRRRACVILQATKIRVPACAAKARFEWCHMIDSYVMMLMDGRFCGSDFDF